MTQIERKVTLLAHTQLNPDFYATFPDEIDALYDSKRIGDGECVALTAIRTCYSPGKPSEIVAKESARYFGKKATDGGKGTDADRLIRMIHSSGHVSTLEHLSYTFAVEGVSRALLAQLTRHRVGFSFSVQSQRYTKYFKGDIDMKKSEITRYKSKEKRHGSCKFTIGEELHMVDLYNEGQSAESIAKIYGSVKTTITGILHANGVGMRKNNEAVLDHDYFAQIDSHLKAQYLGFILADGSVGHYEKGDKTIHQLGIELAEVDGYYLKNFLVDLKSRNNVSETVRGTNSICVVSDKLVSDLEFLGVVPNKTNVVTLKHALTKIPEEFHSSLLLGYFEGNGHLSKDGNSNVLSFATGSEQMASDIAEVLSGIIDASDVKRYQQENAYRVNVHKEASIDLVLSWMYKGVNIERVLQRKFVLACGKSDAVDTLRKEWIAAKSEDCSFVLPSKVLDDAQASFVMAAHLDKMKQSYVDLVVAGIPQEDARSITGQGCKTNLVLTVNLRALLDFYAKRKAGRGAQSEIAGLAEDLRKAVESVEPWTSQLFEAV